MSFWEQEYERLYIYIPEKAQEGDSLSINGGGEWDKVLILPLTSKTQTEVDYTTRNDYIQLGIKLDEERLVIKGDEDQEGLIDFDDQKIKLEGIKNTFQDGDLVGFHWHETLPDGLDGYKPYEIINLTTDDDTTTTSFNLMDPESEEVIAFNDNTIKQTIKNYNSGDRNQGLRLWKARQRDVIHLDSSGAFYEIDGEKIQAEDQTNDAKVIEIIFDGKFKDDMVEMDVLQAISHCKIAAPKCAKKMVSLRIIFRH